MADWLKASGLRISSRRDHSPCNGPLLFSLHLRAHCGLVGEGRGGRVGGGGAQSAGRGEVGHSQ